MSSHSEGSREFKGHYAALGLARMKGPGWGAEKSHSGTTGKCNALEQRI